MQDTPLICYPEVLKKIFCDFLILAPNKDESDINDCHDSKRQGSAASVNSVQCKRRS